MRSLASALVCLGVSSLICLPAAKADWPQFRGPIGNGVVDGLNHPKSWGNESSVAWSKVIPGGGWSSPIVVGKKVFVTSAVDEAGGKPVGFQSGVRNMRGKRPTKPLKFGLYCLDLNGGASVWEKTLAERKPDHPIHPSNTYATESPATDGERIFCYFAAIGLLAAVDLEGEEVWRVEIGSYPTGNGFGTGSSLAVDGDRLFLQCDNDQNSFVVAFDTKTGNEIWRAKRNSRTSWSTPLVWRNNERTELITCGSGVVTSYDPNTGSVLWKLTGIDSSFSASPASDAERIYFGNSGPMSRGPLVAVGSNLKGEVKFDSRNQSDQIAWSRMRSGPGLASPVVCGDHLYVAGRGIISCYSITDGKELYKSRLPGSKSVAASLWSAGGYVFLLDEAGKTFVIKNGPEFKLSATNQINDLFWSTPAISDGALLLRGVNKLYCIR